MKKSADIIFRKHELTCTGDFTEGCSGDRETPPTGHEFDIDHIEHLGVDIYWALELIPGAISEIESLCLTNIMMDYYD